MASTDHALSYKQFGQNLDVKDNSQNLLQRLTDKMRDKHTNTTPHIESFIPKMNQLPGKQNQKMESTTHCHDQEE
jgi:hypothetical protein